MKTAVVILNWNGAAMLARFLPSVVSHSGDAAVIVADNGSTDGSLALLASQFPTVRQIRLDHNYGFAEGYNQALRLVEADYYMLLNSDVEVPEGWLAPLERCLDAHPDVAACQPKLLCQWERSQFEYAGAAGGYIDRLGYPFCRGRLFGTLEQDRGQYDTEADAFWATGAALMIRSAAYWAVGGLDGRFFAHQEEIDLCWRLRARGHRICCVPASVAYHVGGGTLPKENPRKTFLNFRNNLLLLYKNLPDAELSAVMRRRRWLDALAACSFLLKGEWRSFKAVWRARREYRRLRPQFQADREANLAATTVPDIPEMYAGSLLWAYYLAGIKQFSRLNFHFS